MQDIGPENQLKWKQTFHTFSQEIRQEDQDHEKDRKEETELTRGLDEVSGNWWRQHCGSGLLDFLGPQ